MSFGIKAKRIFTAFANESIFKDRAEKSVPDSLNSQLYSTFFMTAISTRCKNFRGSVEGKQLLEITQLNVIYRMKNCVLCSGNVILEKLEKRPLFKNPNEMLEQMYTVWNYMENGLLA